MIDFSLPPEVDDIRLRVRAFIDERVRPEWEAIDQSERSEVVGCIVRLRREAREERGLWLPHMPEEWGGMGLGPTAMAAVSAEAAKVSIGPFVLNAQAPDEGNQHTLLHWGTPEQHERYLRPLCEGTVRSCFAMTEPEVAGSDPTLIRTSAYRDGDEWVINGHKWFISGARGAGFALLVARTEEDPEIPQAANSCVSSSTCQATAGTSCATCRRCRDLTTTARSSSRISVCPMPTCWAVGVRGICSASTGWGRPGSRTACAGSVRRRQRST